MSIDQFPYTVDQISKLESAVQQALLSQARSSATLKSILVIPPFHHSGRRPGRPESTLALTEEHLLVVTRDTSSSNVEVTTIPLKSMIAFEWGVILLYSWIDIAWADSSLRHTRIEFNTVGEPFLRTLLETLRRAVLARTASPIDRRSPLTREQIGARLPIKFANMLILRALLDEELVYTWSFEPALKPKWFGRGWRDGLLWAVTNYHSLFIREPREAYPYGVIFTFCPRSEIRNVRVVEHEQQVELCLTLGESGFDVKGVFPLAHRAELMAATELLMNSAVASSPP